jgi:hypothetical protein
VSEDLIDWLRDVLADMQAHGYLPHATYGIRRRDGAVTTTTEVVVFDPARVLREVRVFREILDDWQKLADANSSDSRDIAERAALWRTIRRLAAVFDDRPGYREEWRP